ncbi:MAG: DUF2854 domain-containing protein [Cyanobacteriota bacterium]
MQSLRSPGTLVTITGVVLTGIVSVADLTDHPNRRLPSGFYGIPIVLGGLALKSSELAPPQRLTPPAQWRDLRNAPASEPLRKLLADVTRWRYGQKVHLESSLQALKLWDENDPPELRTVEELSLPEGYGLRFTFTTGGVPFQRWDACQDRLGRFFGPGLLAEVERVSEDQIGLTLRPLPASPAPAPAEASPSLPSP